MCTITDVKPDMAFIIIFFSSISSVYKYEITTFTSSNACCIFFEIVIISYCQLMSWQVPLFIPSLSLIAHLLLYLCSAFIN